MTRALLREGARALSPAYFALVMATGIVSLAAHLAGMPRIAAALFRLNVAAYVVIWVLMALRAAWFGRELWSDLVDHWRGPGFLASVAATAVLGSQLVVLAGAFALAAALWVLALVLWIALTYTLFIALTIKERKPPLDEGISGGWLLAVVATQAVAVLSAYLAAHQGPARRVELDFLALALWLCGGMQYIWIVCLLFYRYTFFRFAPRDLTPPSWINMGAMAISTLAGSLLAATAPDVPLLAALLPFIKGFTVLYWATGTWWIPLLVLLVVWRHGVGRFPLRYDALYWSAVFPLGMYAVGTFEMARALELDFLDAIPRYATYVALAAWALAFAGLVRALATAIVTRTRVASRDEA